MNLNQSSASNFNIALEETTSRPEHKKLLGSKVLKSRNRVMSSMNQNALRELLDGFEEDQSDIFLGLNN